MRLILFALIISGLGLGCRSTTDRCASGDAPADECCELDSKYAYCGADAGTDGGLDTGGEDVGEDVETTCVPACGDGRVCDLASLTCVGCLADADCGAGVCDEGTQTCVGCLGNGDCAEGVCDEGTQTCVGCLADGDCAGGVCDENTRQCAACLVDGDCVDAVCKTGMTSTQNACVACLDNSRCTQVGASRCAENVCAACVTGADCGHLPGDLKACEDGVCVGCSSATEATDCLVDGVVYACDVGTHVCSTIPVGSNAGCEPCVSSSSCAVGFACVPTNYQGTFAGNYCMPIGVVGTECSGPFGADGVLRQDIDGVEQLVCMITESLTSCAAYDQYGDGCTNDQTVCDAPGASCQLFNNVTNVYRCSYPCVSDFDCKQGITCNSTTTGDFCGSL